MARSFRPIGVVLAVLVLGGTTASAQTALGFRDQALADLRSIQALPPAPPIRPQINQAIRALEQAAFTDADHPAAAGTFNDLGRSLDSMKDAARESLRRGDPGLAQRLRSDAQLVASAARRLVTVALAEVQGLLVDQGSSADFARLVAEAQQDIAEGDAALAQPDPSFNRFPFF